MARLSVGKVTLYGAGALVALAAYDRFFGQSWIFAAEHPDLAYLLERRRFEVCGEPELAARLGRAYAASEAQCVSHLGSASEGGTVYVINPSTQRRLDEVQPSADECAGLRERRDQLDRVDRGALTAAHLFPRRCVAK